MDGQAAPLWMHENSGVWSLCSFVQIARLPLHAFSCPPRPAGVAVPVGLSASNKGPYVVPVSLPEIPAAALKAGERVIPWPP